MKLKLYINKYIYPKLYYHRQGIYNSDLCLPLFFSKKQKSSDFSFSKNAPLFLDYSLFFSRLFPFFSCLFFFFSFLWVGLFLFFFLFKKCSSFSRLRGLICSLSFLVLSLSFLGLFLFFFPAAAALSLFLSFPLLCSGEDKNQRAKKDEEEEEEEVLFPSFLLCFFVSFFLSSFGSFYLFYLFYLSCFRLYFVLFLLLLVYRSSLSYLDIQSFNCQSIGNPKEREEEKDVGFRDY